MWTNKAILTIFIFLLISCSNEIKYEAVDIKAQAQNASLPTLLVKKLSEHFKNANPEIQLSKENIYNKFGFYSKEVWPLKVQIMTKKMKSAKVYNIFDTSARLDLNGYLSLNKEVEDFYLTISLKTQKFNKLYIYFIPSLKSDKNKCDKFYDITKYYQEKLSDKVIFSRNEKHYIKNQLGTYVFFSPLDKETYQLNILQLTDSSVSDRLCVYF